MSRAKTQPADTQHALSKMISAFGYSHSTWETFADFVELGACAISNAVDWPQREKREAQYMAIIKKYTPEEAAEFPKMFGTLTMALESATEKGGEVSRPLCDSPDVLGFTYHELELHNKWAGQYFTPFNICSMMAQMTMGDKETLEAKIAADGFIRLSEPACGSGAMVIAFALAMRDAGVNYQQTLHVTATDVDLKCVCMTYLQLSLLHIPAVVIRANTLSAHPFGESEEDRWYTPAHIMGGWDWRLRRGRRSEAIKQPAAPALPEIPSGAQLTLF